MRCLNRRRVSAAFVAETRRIYHYTTTRTFYQEEIFHKDLIHFSLNFVQYSDIDFFKKLYYN